MHDNVTKSAGANQAKSPICLQLSLVLLGKITLVWIYLILNINIKGRSPKKLWGQDEYWRQVTSGKWMPDVAEFCVRTPISFFDASKRCVWQNIVPIWKVVASNFAIRRILPAGEFWHQENFGSRRLGCCLWCEGWKISTNPSVAITSAAQQTNQLVNEDGFVGLFNKIYFLCHSFPKSMWALFWNFHKNDQR